MTILAIGHRTFTLGSDFVTVRSGIVDIGYRCGTTLIVKSSVCLIMKSVRTCSVGFFDIHLNLGKMLIPI